MFGFTHLRIFRTFFLPLALSFVVFWPMIAEASEGHNDPVVPVLIGLSVILVSAVIGRNLAKMAGQPEVLGELVMGMIIGNLHLAGISFFDGIVSDSHLDVLSRLGVIVLLFMVGLESNVREMAKVGIPSLAVATVGVVVPFVLGFLVSRWFLPEADFNVHLFTGATLTATSVGITARVFKDLGKLGIPEAKIVLGAAVIDDVMGLVVLAVVSGIIQTGSLQIADVLIISGKSLLFLVVSVFVGLQLAPILGRLAMKVQGDGIKLVTVLVFAFIYSALANAFGLATIVGAFAAGLVLDEVHFTGIRRTTHGGNEEEELHVEDLLKITGSFLVPVFFVLMGMQVGLETFMDPAVIGIALALIMAAIIGKQACGLVVMKKYDGLLVGLGMIPRGEVGLIFAGIGKGLGVVNDSLFSAIVIMVIMTTFVTPPLLKWRLDRLEEG